VFEVTAWHEGTNPLNNFRNLVEAVGCVLGTFLLRRQVIEVCIVDPIAIWHGEPTHCIYTYLCISYIDLETIGHMMLFSVIAAIRSIPLCLAGCDVEISQILNSLENRCVTGLLLTLDMYVLSVCCALKSHVNAFSSNFKRNPDCCKIVRDWSSRQYSSMYLLESWPCRLSTHHFRPRKY
jgi:hypothetical protein